MRHKKFFTALCALAFCSAAAACGGDSNESRPQEPPEETARHAAEISGAAAGEVAPAAAAESAAEAAPAAAGVSANRPYACLPGDVEAGRAHYMQLCAQCHGIGGAGDGPGAAGLRPAPASHNDGAYMNAISNEELLLVIAKGGAAVGKSPLMAPWGGALGEQGVQDAAAFVRSLAAPPYQCP